MTDCIGVEGWARNGYWSLRGSATSPADTFVRLRADNFSEIIKYGKDVIVDGMTFMTFQAVGVLTVDPSVDWHVFNSFTTTAATFQFVRHSPLGIPVLLTPTSPVAGLGCTGGFGATVVQLTAWGRFIPGPEQAQIQPVSVESITWFPKKPKVGVI